MRSQISSEDRSRLPGRGAVGEVKRGGRKASDRTKERIHKFTVRFGRGRRVSRRPCLSLGDDRQGMSGSRDVSLMIFITSVSGGKSLVSFTKRFFHFSRPSGLRLTFDGAENGKFGYFQCRESKESSGKRKRLVFLCRRTVKVELKSKVIPTSFLKLEGRGTFVEAKDRRKRNSL